MSRVFSKVAPMSSVSFVSAAVISSAVMDVGQRLSMVTYAREFKKGASFGVNMPWVENPAWVGGEHGPAG